MIVLAYNPKTEISACESISCIGEDSKSEAILLSPPAGSRFGDSGGCYLNQTGDTDVRLQFFQLPQQGSIEAQGLTGDYKIGQKVANISKGLSDIQLKQGNKNSIII